MLQPVDQCLQELPLEQAGVWWIRFAMDPACSVLACGNQLGEVYLWDPHEVSQRAKTVLKRPVDGKRVKDVTVRVFVWQALLTLLACSLYRL